MEIGNEMVIYIDYNSEQRFENVSNVFTDDGTLSFKFYDEERNLYFKAQYDMSKLLGFVYEI